MLKHQKTGFKPSVFNAIEHNMLETKLNNSQNGLQGYVELKDWIEKESGKTFNYNTLLLPHCNADNFQVFLNDFSKENPKELKIMVLDNGRFHKAKRLIIPENIVLIFLPPYSPELNPAEKIWAKYKREFSNKFYNSLEDVEDFITNVVKATSKKEVMSICGYNYIFLNEIWTI
jgi:transposase